MNKILTVTMFIFVCLMCMASCTDAAREEEKDPCVTDACVVPTIDEEPLQFTIERIPYGEGTRLLTDNETGCQYIINNGITPRMDGDIHVCSAKDVDPLITNHQE